MIYLISLQSLTDSKKEDVLTIYRIEMGEGGWPVCGICIIKSKQIKTFQFRFFKVSEYNIYQSSKRERKKSE